MTEIIAGKLWLGSECDAQNDALIRCCDIQATLTIATEASATSLVPNYKHPITERLTERIQPCFFAAFSQINAHDRVMVHCMAGVNRSATVVVAYLMFSQRMTLRDAFILVRTKRPRVRPTEQNMKELMEYELELFGVASLTENYKNELPHNRFCR